MSAFTAADDKQVTVLVGLDLSAAFDTVNHETLSSTVVTSDVTSGFSQSGNLQLQSKNVST